MTEHYISLIIDSLSMVGAFIGMHRTEVYDKFFKFYLLAFIGFFWLLCGDIDILEGNIDYIISEQPLRSLVFRSILTIGIWVMVIGTKRNGCKNNLNGHKKLLHSS